MAEIIEYGTLGGGQYRTFVESVTEWTHGDVKERIVVPAGETTDFSSIPDSGFMGWLARALGFVKDAEYFKRSGKIHDMLYFFLKYRAGFLPVGWYQYFNPVTNQWEAAIAYKWNRQQADAIWRRVSIEDGCPEKIATRGYRFLRVFGGIHMAFH